MLDIDILFVEDDLSVRSLYGDLAEIEGYSYLLIGNPYDASSKIESRSLIYRLGVFDLNLKDYSGPDFVTLSKRVYPKVPVICVTGQPKAPDLADAYFRKPFSIDSLLRAFRRGLSGDLRKL